MNIISLKNQKEFDLVNKHGAKQHGSSLILVLSKKFNSTKSTKIDATYFGIKVSRKYSKKAVIRNKVKRRVRHLMRIMVANPALDTQNKAMIIIPKKGLHTEHFARLKADFCCAFKNATKSPPSKNSTSP